MKVMPLKKIIFLIGMLLAVGQGFAQNRIKCQLKGTVVDRPQSTTLILLRSGDDPRIGDKVNIPIVEGRFEYLLECNFNEMYELIFQEEFQRGSMRVIPFFSENGTVEFTIYDEARQDDNKVTGGVLNAAYNDYSAKIHAIYENYNPINEKIDELYETGNYYTVEAQQVRTLADKLWEEGKHDEARKQSERLDKMEKDGVALSSAASALQMQAQQIGKMVDSANLAYARNHTDLVGYFVAFQQFQGFRYSVSDPTPWVELYKKVYSVKFPNHTYTARVGDLMAAMEIKVGGRYVDVIAQTLDGRDVNLSEKITGKVALIHLWASWCGPCRLHGRDMIPIYNDFKDKGFTVVGIARESKSTDEMKAARAKDGYPWEDLVELNDREHIWARYGLGNSGGGEILVDERGTILAIGATAAETRAILEKILNR